METDNVVGSDLNNPSVRFTTFVRLAFWPKVQTITFGKLHKLWRKRKSPPSLKGYSSKEDSKLCVVATLEQCLKRTNFWRRKDKSQLLLIFVKPHSPVVSWTISGWIENVLREAGIDTKIFKGHSTHSASTSKAGLAGLSVTDILERGSWTNASTWQRFYIR